MRSLVKVRLRPEVDLGTSVSAWMDEHARDAWRAFTGAFGQVELRPLFGRRLDPLVARARRLTPDYVPAPFERYYTAWLPEGADVALARRHLEALPVEHVVIEDRRPPPPAAVEYDGQLHLHPSTVGIGVKAAWALPGGRGQGQVLCDVEMGWDIQHPDLSSGAAIALLPGGVHHTDYTQHGLHVLGTLAAVENGLGSVGVVPGLATIHLSSEYRVGQDLNGPPDTAAAIVAALEVLQPGHVLLLETQKLLSFVFGSGASAIQVPCEIEDDLYELVRLATALHVVVVEAAGNGVVSGPLPGVDLDLQPAFDPAVRDSGAILVGQASWQPPDHEPVPKGCIGTRIDCFAWGVGVATTTKLSNGSYAHTPGFNGTSAASAIVAGVAVAVQGMVQAAHGRSLTPLQMRALLRDPALGTLSANGLADRIGVMPDLGKIVDALALPADLYLRDHVGDTGAPHEGPLSRSPDIIVRTAPVSDPWAAFGPDSGTLGDDDLSEVPVLQQSAEIYLRVHNRGGEDALGAVAKVYCAPTGTLLHPADWVYIGKTSVDVPAASLAVAGPIAWTPDIAGHQCLMAVVGLPEVPGQPAAEGQPAVPGQPGDPLLDVATLGSLADSGHFARWVRTENGLTYRNISVADAAPPPAWMSAAAGDRDEDRSANAYQLVFRAGAIRQEGEVSTLTVDSRLPRGARVWIEVPHALRGTLALPGVEEGPRCGTWLVPLTAPGRALVGRLVLRREPVELSLHVLVPAGLHRPGLEIAVVQAYEGREVGRVTWRLAGRRDGDAGPSREPDRPPSPDPA